MTRKITQGRGIFALMALAIGMLFLLACTSQPAPAGGEAQPSANQNRIGAELVSLLSEQSAPGLRAGYSGTQNGNTGVWVSGTGEATAKPDLAILNMGVEAMAKTVSESRSQAAEAMAATIADLQEEGVALDDIQTRTFNISPRYTRHEVTRCPSKTQDTSTSSQRVLTEGTVGSTRHALPLDEARVAVAPLPGGPVIESFPSRQNCYKEFEQVLLGFQVTNQLTVKVRDLDNVGQIIDRTTDAGGDLTRFQNVSFTFEDSKGLEDQARESAVKDMMAKAEQVASVAGVELGMLVYVTETGRPAPVSFDTSRMMIAKAESVPTTILSGEMKVSITVQGVFEIAGVQTMIIS